MDEARPELPKLPEPTWVPPAIPTGAAAAWQPPMQRPMTLPVQPMPMGQAMYTESQMREYGRAAVLAERERCAKLCDAVDAEEQHDSPYYGIAKECAAAIRQGV